MSVDARAMHETAENSPTHVAMRPGGSGEAMPVATEALHRAFDLQNRLIDLALGGAGLPALVDCLAAAIGNPVALADQLFHLLASSPRELHGDRHRREALQLQGTPRSALDDPLVGARFRLVAERRQPTLFPAFPDHGMDHRRLMTPVIAGDEILGYVTVLEERPFADDLSDTLRQATKVIALALLNRRIALETESHLITDFLGDLLSGRLADRDSVVSRAGFLGIDLFRAWTVLIVRADDIAAVAAAARAENPIVALQRLYDVVRRRVRQRFGRTIVVVQGESIVLLHAATAGGEGAGADPTAVAADLRQEVARMLTGATVSVAISGVCRAIGDFPTAYAEARRALDVARNLGRRDATVSLEELGLYGLLFRHDDRDHLDRFAQRLLGPIVAYDRQRKTRLVETLEVYLREGAGFRATARRLGIHLNTLRGRLERIRAISGIDLGDPQARLELEIALEIVQVSKNPD